MITSAKTTASRQNTRSGETDMNTTTNFYCIIQGQARNIYSESAIQHTRKN
jgi:hypothetical protein